MYGSPYWSSMIPMMPQYIQPQIQPQQPIQPQIPQTQQPIQQPVQQQQSIPQAQPQISSTPNTWNWKVVANYQAMLMESIPFDGTPVLFMLQNESTFYVVNMVDGHKMVNGYSFVPLDQGKQGTTNIQSESKPSTTEDRIAKLETNITTIMGQLNKLVGGTNNESNNEPTEQTVQRQSISNV